MCNVPITKWPASAVSIAASIVSLSRISPITRISQSSLKQFLTPSLYVKTSCPYPTSFCTITDCLHLCLNSTGLSSVSIFLFCVSFISFINAFKVVVLPEFVLPVTRTKPCGWYIILLTISGTPSSSNVGNSFFISLNVNTGTSPDKDMLTLKRSPLNSNDESSFFVFVKTASLSMLPLMK